MKKYSKGFTLIELLVVIAIIGILSSVVLASLNTARNKGSDAAAKAGFAQLRNQAELYYDGAGNGTYGASGDTCVVGSEAGMFTATATKAIIANINSNTTSTTTCSVATNGVSWAAVTSTLKGGGSWCVDSSGFSKAGTASAGVCS